LERSNHDLGPVFQGIVPMQVTPFQEDGRLDLEGLARTVEWQTTLGVTSVSALGMAGEFYKLATDEIEAVISCVVEASGPVPTLVGVSASSSEVAVRLARHAEAAGADALLVLPPHSIKPSALGLIEYYAAIATATSLPIVVQDGSDEIRAVIPLDLLLRLCATVPAITHIKVEDVAPAQKITVLRESLDGIALLCGSGGLGILDAYDRGCLGCISGAATADAFVRLDRAYWDGDRATAQQIYRGLLPLIQFQCQSTELFVTSEKRILNRKGLIDNDRVRRPGYEFDLREQALLDDLCNETGLVLSA
jgi:dihydrodipicolinate synthase/N-acetylneuraminate lyase